MNKYVIETKQLTKTYGEQTVVNSVNIHVKQGHIYSSYILTFNRSVSAMQVRKQWLKYFQLPKEKLNRYSEI